jgi:hypothetical protein
MSYTSTIYAHDWEILGDERIPRWPSKTNEKRKLKVSINSWVGISIGAKHYNVKVEEQNNMWWCEDKNSWVELSCDSEKGGYELEAKLLTEAEAIKVAKFFIKLVAGKDCKNHEVVWDDDSCPKEYLPEWKKSKKP